MGAEAPGEERIRKQITVVVCDISGLTTLAERLDADSLGQAIDGYLDRIRRALERHGGWVDRFLGSAIMGVFGLPRVHEDDAMRALRATEEIRDAVATLNAELQHRWGTPVAVRTGVHTGTVVAGSTKLETAVIGEVVSVAVRLEQAARSGEILVGEDTHRLVRDAVTVEPVAPLVVEGRQEPIGAVRLLKVDPVDRGQQRRLSSAMVGRDRELNILHEAFERVVRDQTCHLFTVLGAAGVGKSRLLHEFTATVRERATVLQGRCLPYGDGITLWPVVDVIRQAARLGNDDPPEVVHAKLTAALVGEGHAPPRSIADRVAELLGLGDVVGVPEEHSWAVRKLLEAVARRRPLVIVFDDLHWGEPTFLHLVEHVAEWSRDAPILLVCVARPELIDSRPGWGGGLLNATSISLEPLTEAECRRLVANLLGDAQPAEAAMARVGEAADGNPLFLEELLAMLIEDGILRRVDGCWKPTGDLARIAVPPTITSLLSVRLEQLERGERMGIERAAVVGKVFYLTALQHLLPESAHPELLRSLWSLVRKDLVRPFLSDLGDEEAFRFRHILIRDAAYEALPKALRAELHEQLAQWLEQRSGERAREFEEIIAHHLEMAYRYRRELGLVDERSHRLARRTVERLARAGNRALVLGDLPASVKLFSRASSLLPNDDPVRLDVSVKLGEALTRIGSFEEADKVLSDVLANAAGNPSLEAYGRIERTFARISTETAGSIQEALSEARRAIALFEEVNDEQGLIRAWNLIAEVFAMQGRSADRKEALQHSLAYARSLGEEREESWVIWGTIGAMADGSTPAEEVIRFAEEQLEWARSQGHRWVEVGALMHLGHMHAMQGHFERARALVTQGMAVCDDLGLEVVAGSMSQISGSVERLAGDLQAAERELRRGYEVLEAHGEKSYLSTVAAQLADVLYDQERYDEAEWFARASEAAAWTEDVASQVLWRGTQARVLARRGAIPEADRLASEAVALAEGMDDLDCQGEALAGLAEVLRLSGRPREAGEQMKRAERLWERKGNLVGRRRARAWRRRLHRAGAQEPRQQGTEMTREAR